MVSLWPWKGDDSSTAHFERTLSSLKTKLARANAQETALRSHARRYKFLWTLYASFIYILYTIILVLVTGIERWAVVEYGLVVGGPVVLWTVRTFLDTYYNYRISNTSANIKVLEQQRRQAITRFKQATKYDSTQQLLEKYGADENKSTGSQNSNEKTASKKAQGSKGQFISQHSPSGRTNLAPPPTANIRRPTDASSSQNSSHAPQVQTRSVNSVLRPRSPSSPDTVAEFAPNADVTPPQYAPSFMNAGPKWYDRIMDLMLGEDESKPINRLALICSNCHLVNGQAPPGVKTLNELGRWKCFSCRAWNEEEGEAKRIAAAAGGGADDPSSVPSSPTTTINNEETVEPRRYKSTRSKSDSEHSTDDENGEIHQPGDLDEAPPAQPTRTIGAD